MTVDNKPEIIDRNQHAGTLLVVINVSPHSHKNLGKGDRHLHFKVVHVNRELLKEVTAQIGDGHSSVRVIESEAHLCRQVKSSVFDSGLQEPQIHT